MKIDNIFDFSANFQVGSSGSKNVGKGRAEGILIRMGSGDPQFARNLMVTVKTRTEKDVIVHVNRMPVFDFVLLTDLNAGYGGAQLSGAMERIANNLLPASITGGATELTFIKSFLGSAAFQVFIPLGHITLGNQELEVTLEALAIPASVSVQNVFVSLVHKTIRPDYYLIYDESQDFEQQHKNVRSLYLLAKGTNVLSDPAVTTGLIQIDADRSYLAKVPDAVAASNIFKNVEQYGHTQIASLYEETAALPTDMYIKITSVDTTKCKIVLVKEKMVLASTSDSTKVNLDELLKKVEKLERESPEAAKAYRHAGVIVKSEVLQDAKDTIKQSEKRDEPK